MAEIADADLDRFRLAIERLQVADAAAMRRYTPAASAEMLAAQDELERISAALLPSILAEITELRRLVRLHGAGEVP
jgi:hypothetical protein